MFSTDNSIRWQAIPMDLSSSDTIRLAPGSYSVSLSPSSFSEPIALVNPIVWNDLLESTRNNNGNL